MDAQPQQQVSPDPAQLAIYQKKMNLEAARRNGINWFYWISALSIVNSAIYFVGGSLSFVVGLGITQFVDGLASAVAEDFAGNAATIVRLVGLVIDLVFASLFFLAGFLGHRKQRWAVITGMVLYALDAIIFILAGGWLGVAFHAFALWGLLKGLQAMSSMRSIERPVESAVPVLP